MPKFNDLHMNIGYTAPESVIDASTIKDPELVIVFASGNRGAEIFLNQDHDQILRQVVAEPSAKSIIIVGITYNKRWFKVFPIGGGRTILVADHILDGDPNYNTKADLANAPRFNIGNVRQYFSRSSRGPTEYGILKPYVVAPGAGNLVANSPGVMPPNGSHVTDPYTCFVVSTSFAAPFVAGLAADLRQALRTGGGLIRVRVEQPPGMLIKALIVNGAQDLRGTVFEWYPPDGSRRTIAMPSSPNNATGFGLVNLRRSLVPLTEDGGAVWDDTVLNGTESLTQLILFPATDPDLRTILPVTLTWADVPGEEVNNYL